MDASPSAAAPRRSAAIEALKTLRAAPAFNVPATSALRMLTGALGVRSEWLIRHLPRSGHVAAPLPNGATLRLWSRGDDWVANQVFWRGWNGYEPETSSLFFRLAANARTVLDVGAHVGYYSLLAALANPETHVYAFEPLPIVLDRLRGNIELNGLQTRVTCVAGAAAAGDGTTEIFYPATTGIPSSASLSRPFVVARAAVESARVRLMTIDGFVRDHDIRSVDLVKMDTETTEPDVLRGMTNVLRRDRPLIISEVLKDESNAVALEEILRPLQYRYYMLDARGSHERPHVTPEAGSLNYLFVPTEKPVPRDG